MSVCKCRRDKGYRLPIFVGFADRCLLTYLSFTISTGSKTHLRYENLNGGVTSSKRWGLTMTVESVSKRLYGSCRLSNSTGCAYKGRLQFVPLRQQNEAFLKKCCVYIMKR